jgi:hypothetical protein
MAHETTTCPVPATKPRTSVRCEAESVNRAFRSFGRSTFVRRFSDPPLVSSDTTTSSSFSPGAA